MARTVHFVMNHPQVDFILRGPGGLVSKDITKRTFRVYRWGRILAPVRSGNLKKKIVWEVRHGASGPRGRVTSKAKYSMAVHEGSKAHWIYPRKKKALYWDASKTNTRWKTWSPPYKRVWHPGTHSNEFLSKALLRAVED